jgi:tetratricopeptide (TPR) repeat protein
MRDLKLTAAEHALAKAKEALTRKDHQAAVAAFASAAAAGASPKITARPHALALSELGHHAEAVAVFKPLFARNQKDGTVVNLMGVLLKRAGRLQKAAEVLELARKLRPQDLSPWQNLGKSSMPLTVSAAVLRLRQMIPGWRVFWCKPCTVAVGVTRQKPWWPACGLRAPPTANWP